MAEEISKSSASLVDVVLGTVLKYFHHLCCTPNTHVVDAEVNAIPIEVKGVSSASVIVLNGANSVKRLNADDSWPS